MAITKINPLITVVTASFNSAKTIKRTIESIIQQEYSNIEYIIIDGGSADGTVDIIKSYVEEFNERGIAYKWISEPDKGLYDAMNKGIRLAAGEFVGILGSDDWYELTALQAVAKAIADDSQADLIYGVIKYQCAGVAIGLEQIYSNQLPERPIDHPGVIYRKSLHDKYGYYSTQYKVASDYAFLLACYLHKSKFVAIDNLIANFSLGGTSSRLAFVGITECAHIRYMNNLITSKTYCLLRLKALVVRMAKLLM